MSLKIQLFGRFSVSLDDENLSGLDSGKEQELLSYLLMYRERPHARETLAGLLWGDCTTEKSKKYLRQALWHLQSSLDSCCGTEGAASVLAVDHDWVQLNAQTGLWLDVAEFESAFLLAQGSSGQELAPAKIEALKKAVLLYRGDLLEGWYHDWCFYERERFQNMYLTMLDKLMTYCEASREFELGLLYGSHILRHDRASERTHRRLMNLQYLSGNRTAALRQYERCAAALDEELGVEPDKLTLSLYHQICADTIESAPGSPVSDEVLAPSSSASMTEVLSRLKELQNILTETQQRVQKEIKSVELALSKTLNRFNF